jgi:hypothetical protein
VTRSFTARRRRIVRRVHFVLDEEIAEMNDQLEAAL